jgi:hypothetical protein
VRRIGLTVIGIYLSLAFHLPAASGYLLPAQTVNSALVQSSPPEVLIYYSNATAPDAREQNDYRQIVQWLYDSEEPRLIEIAKEFEFDLSHFPLMVDRDLRAIEGSLSQASGTLAGVIVASNPLAREGKLKVWRYPENKFREIPLQLPRSTDAVTQSNPLASRTALETVLSRAKLVFDPQVYPFILVTKSHGTADLLMTPRLVTPAVLGKDQVLALARGEAPLDHPRPGVSKSDFIEILNDLNKSPPMRFSLIFLESCESGSELLELPNLPNNIGTIIATDDTGAQSNTISYDVLLTQINHAPKTSASRQFLDYLNQRAKILNPYPVWGRFRFHLARFVQARGLYFVPLLLFVVYFAWNRSRRLSSG